MFHEADSEPSHRRGVLELEELIGPWSAKNLPQLPPKGVEEYEALMGVESPELLKIVTGIDPVPKVLLVLLSCPTVTHTHLQSVSGTLIKRNVAHAHERPLAEEPVSQNAVTRNSASVC